MKLKIVILVTALILLVGSLYFLMQKSNFFSDTNKENKSGNIALEQKVSEENSVVAVKEVSEKKDEFFTEDAIEKVFGSDFSVSIEPNISTIPKNSREHNQYYKNTTRITIKHKSDLGRVYIVYIDTLKTITEKDFFDSGLTPISVAGKKFFTHRDSFDTDKSDDYMFSLVWPVQGEWDIVRLDVHNLSAIDFLHPDLEKLLVAFPFDKGKYDKYFDGRAREYSSSNESERRIYGKEVLKIDPRTNLTFLATINNDYSERLIGSYYIDEIYMQPSRDVTFLLKKLDSSAVRNMEIREITSEHDKEYYRQLLSKAKKVVDTSSELQKLSDGTTRAYSKYYYETNDGTFCFISNTNRLVFFANMSSGDEFFHAKFTTWSSNIQYSYPGAEDSTWLCSTDVARFFQNLK
jgi:hypothetical protein